MVFGNSQAKQFRLLHSGHSGALDCEGRKHEHNNERIKPLLHAY